jgi:hypothetical protein
MSSRNANGRKRKPATIPETVFSDDDGRNPKERKARRVSTTNASVSAAASDTPVATENATTANTTSAATDDGESIQSIGKMIQDLFCSDNAKVNAALDALYLDLGEDKRKRESLVTAGGSFALVHLMQNCFDKAIAGVPACDQVAELNELTELTTLHKTFTVVFSLTLYHEESRFGIAAIGGEKAFVKVMKTFPKCQELQERLCLALLNLTWCSIGKANRMESRFCLPLSTITWAVPVSTKTRAGLCTTLRAAARKTPIN